MSPISFPVSDQAADPYGWFLSRVYDARKDATATYVADTGHTLTQETHSASTHSFTTRWKNGTLRNYANVRIECGSKAPALNNWGSTSYSSPKPDWATLAAFGQQAIANRAPARANFEASQFLGELREGLPSIIGAAVLKGRVKDVMKNAGGEYLNLQFGWLPLVSEIKKLCSTLMDVESILTNKRGQNGKPVRASFAPPALLSSDTQTFSTLVLGAVIGDLNVGSHVSPAIVPLVRAQPSGYVTTSGLDGYDVKIIRSVSTERRFSGSFTSNYSYPGANADWLEKATALMNLELTPTVLWELAPWSWLVDWFFKIQSTIESNQIAADKRIVMNYGYVTQVDRMACLITGNIAERGSSGDPTFRAPFTSMSEHSYIKRMRANPFGFQASSWSGLSLDQLAILGALGIRRA